MPQMTCAVAYLRTSSATNVGGDSDVRQRLAIQEHAGRTGRAIEREFYDVAVKGADALDSRPGFVALLAWCREHGCREIIVESASRFARDLIVQETGYKLLCREGFKLIAADDPDAFTADTPTANLVRQILGAVAEFEKANLVSKLRGARDRKSIEKGQRIEGRKGYADRQPDLVALVRSLAEGGLTQRQIAAEINERGHRTSKGTPINPGQVSRLLST